MCLGIILSLFVIAQPLTCVAKMDCVAKSDDELMFLAGDEIIILQKLGNGFYMVRTMHCLIKLNFVRVNAKGLMGSSTDHTSTFGR